MWMQGKRKKFKNSSIRESTLLISRILGYIAVYCLLSTAADAIADSLRLQDLIDETLKNNHEILSSESRVAISNLI